MKDSHRQQRGSSRKRKPDPLHLPMVACLQDDAPILATNVNLSPHRDYHEEVVQALTAIGNPALGKAIREDRGSQLEHLGIRCPDLRQRVK